ncbi:MAG: hypothetical protein C0458_14615 [Methylobacterium sp.]|nr:hypothetical protein [Methylobacterium sp.]
MMTNTHSNALDTARDTRVALTDAEFDGVSGAGLGQTIFGIALTTAGVPTTVAGVAGRATNMIVDGIAISRLPEPPEAQKARPRRSETGRDCAKSSGRVVTDRCAPASP